MSETTTRPSGNRTGLPDPQDPQDPQDFQDFQDLQDLGAGQELLDSVRNRVGVDTAVTLVLGGPDDAAPGATLRGPWRPGEEGHFTITVNRPTLGLEPHVLAAVFAHELGHLGHGRLVSRSTMVVMLALGWVLRGVLVLLLAVGLVARAGRHLVPEPGAGTGSGPAPGLLEGAVVQLAVAASGMVPVLAVAAAVFAALAYEAAHMAVKVRSMARCRSQEFEADLFAVAAGHGRGLVTYLEDHASEWPPSPREELARLRAAGVEVEFTYPARYALSYAAAWVMSTHPSTRARVLRCQDAAASWAVT